MLNLPSNLAELRAAWRIAENLTTTKPDISSKLSVLNKTTGETSFYVYGMIGLEDDQAENFVREVRATQGPINLFINSLGGFVYDAVSMYDVLINSTSKVHVKISGLAASAASFLAMAGDTVEIAEAGRMMIHDAQGIGIGSPADLREYADLMDSVSNDIAGIYAKRAGGKPTAWRSAMTATTWYNSYQAVDSKLADSVSKGNKEGPDNRTRLIQARARVLTSMKGR